MCSPLFSLYFVTMNDEMKILEEWCLGICVVRNREESSWLQIGVCTIKYHADGFVERYKAMLVAKRHIQTYGVDYLKTFPLIPKVNIIMILLSLTTFFDWNLQQFDVKNMFLYEELKREKIIYRYP